MKKLKQNSLSEATTELGFVKVLNANAEELGTEKIYLSREKELEDGTRVIVEGITPHKMKNILNSKIGDEKITFKTPGETVKTEEGELQGVVQLYNTERDSVISNLAEPISNDLDLNEPDKDDTNLNDTDTTDDSNTDNTDLDEPNEDNTDLDDLLSDKSLSDPINADLDNSKEDTEEA